MNPLLWSLKEFCKTLLDIVNCEKVHFTIVNCLSVALVSVLRNNFFLLFLTSMPLLFLVCVLKTSFSLVLIYFYDSATLEISENFLSFFWVAVVEVLFSAGFLEPGVNEFFQSVMEEFCFHVWNKSTKEVYLVSTRQWSREHRALEVARASKNGSRTVIKQGHSFFPWRQNNKCFEWKGKKEINFSLLRFTKGGLYMHCLVTLQSMEDYIQTWPTWIGSSPRLQGYRGVSWVPRSPLACRTQLQMHTTRTWRSGSGPWRCLWFSCRLESRWSRGCRIQWRPAGKWREGKPQPESTANRRMSITKQWKNFHSNRKSQSVSL